MFDVLTYALLKKQISMAAAGIEKVEFIDGTLIFTLPDGSTISTPLDISSGVAGASLNEEGALVIERWHLSYLRSRDQTRPTKSRRKSRCSGKIPRKSS